MDNGDIVKLGDSRSGAQFSSCMKYRYALWRNSDDSSIFSKRLVFIGLNPSTADHSIDDPTIRRCKGFAKLWGYERMAMINAYAFRSTKPKDMFESFDPIIGEHNDDILKHYCLFSDKVIASWGTNCPESRQSHIRNILHFKDIYCLGTNKNGSPKHPLYLKSDTQPELLWKKHDK